MNTHPSFDPEEAAIASELVPEGAEPGSSETEVPTDSGQPPADQAPIAQQQQEPPAGPAAAAQGEQPAQPPAQQGGDARAALRASRRQEKMLRDRVQQLERQLEDAKAGKQTAADSESTELTPEEEEELRQDFPAQYKVYQRARQLEQQIARQQPATSAAETEFQPRLAPPEVQTLIDEVPVLVTWQHDPAAQDKFDKAIEYDEALRHDPDWKGRPVVDRFTEAARRAAAAFAAPTPAPSTAAPAAPRIDPAAAIANARVSAPKGISDFPGGAPANSPTIDYSRMSDEAILASLPVEP